MSLEWAKIVAAINGKKLSPKIISSEKYKHWVSIEDLVRCILCAKMHGKIWMIEEIANPEPPVHDRCRCSIDVMQAIISGTATAKKMNGADWWLKQFGKLPNDYINAKEAKLLGYDPLLGNLAIVAPGKTLVKGEYKNRNGHLPSAPGRKWYEADINYYWGYRGSERILYSNDGLIFATYDHYKTFFEIV